ncbi:hypothetical protein BCR42DRAFT_401308 [Absidia repens]|uniref:Sld7 C-terminal domain-containing protein n=1 Tax=Absidia repens TaxID=90262 RepID=A0A1X2J2D8_9FUNG|nr:hypothetical protein BCR42DRAFT_401308 [Absidia repens]
MDANTVLNGTVRLRKGSTWRGQHDLEDLSLVKHTTNSKDCGLHKVSFTVESVIPLHTVKLYSLTSQRYYAFTKSSILSDFLSQVYNPMSIYQQPKYALLICIRNNGLIPANPFDDNEIVYPLAKESYMLLIGRKFDEHSQGSISLQVFGQVLRDRFDYPNFYNLSNDHNIKPVPSFTFGDNSSESNINHGDVSSPDMTESILQSYRPDLFSKSKQLQQHHEQQNQHTGSSYIYHHQRQQSWKSLLKKDMDRLGKLDQLRDESRRNRPERKLNVIKRKLIPHRKNGNMGLQPPPPPLPSTLEKSASASSLLPSADLKRQPSLPTNPISASKSNIPASLQQSSSESSCHDTNKKQLKSAIWSKLLQDGHDKKSEDTKQLYHCIYQSMQYALRKSFKTNLLDYQLMDSLIDSHIHFYSSLELPNTFS